jgi:hypothetical protein
MTAFPPITHVAVTLSEAPAGTASCWVPSRSWTKTSRPEAFTTRCSRSVEGSYSACIPTPRPQATPSTSTVPVLIMLPSPAATAMSCRHGLRVWTSLASCTAESRTPTTALVSPSATRTESPLSSSRRPPDPRSPAALRRKPRVRRGERTKRRQPEGRGDCHGSCGETLPQGNQEFHSLGDSARAGSRPRRSPSDDPSPASRPGQIQRPGTPRCRADQRALHDSLNPAASRAATDGSLAADFCSASISR